MGVVTSSTPFPAVVAGVTGQVTLAPVYTSVANLTTRVSSLEASGVPHVKRLFQNITTVGLAALTSEQVLHTFNVPANTLVNTGDALRIRTWIKCLNNGNNKGAKVYFGGTVLGDSTGQTFNNVGFTVDAYVFRVASTTQKAILTAVQPNVNSAWSIAIGGGFDDSAPSEDLTTPITVKVTGVSAVAGGLDDIQVLETVIDYEPAST